jgi:hypothetical protein
MKKAIILIAAILVVLIPTYILVFQLARTAPELTIGDDTLDPAFVRWCVVNRDGEEVVTSRSLAKAQKQFEKSEPIKLSSAEQLGDLSFSREPSQCVILFYDLSGAGVTYTPMTLEQLKADGVTLSGSAQAVMTVAWQISDSIRVEAAYSFLVEV